jgi:hypothetical protein
MTRIKHIAIRTQDIEKTAAFSHVGFQVDDVEATLARIDGLGGKPLTDRTEVNPTDPSRPQSYYEVKCLGPDEQVIDVSRVGWVGAE